ncbi:hypothetical protein DFH09DRAFT_1152494 [Mycena vulgaris]|nr:hypothetical protein DFH09DRAFT_1152494 [Mycena vulgaris]
MQHAAEEMYEASGRRHRPWACNGKSLRVGEIILIIDSDTIVPDDCFCDAAREMYESPDVAIIRHESGTHFSFRNYNPQATRRPAACRSASRRQRTPRGTPLLQLRTTPQHRARCHRARLTQTTTARHGFGESAQVGGLGSAAEWLWMLEGYILAPVHCIHHLHSGHDTVPPRDLAHRGRQRQHLPPGPSTTASSRS